MIEHRIKFRPRDICRQIRYTNISLALSWSNFWSLNAAKLSIFAVFVLIPLPLFPLPISKNIGESYIPKFQILITQFLIPIYSLWFIFMLMVALCSHLRYSGGRWEWTRWSSFTDRAAGNLWIMSAWLFLLLFLIKNGSFFSRQHLYQLFPFDRARGLRWHIVHYFLNIFLALVVWINVYFFWSL